MAESVGLARSDLSAHSGSAATSDAQYPMRINARRRIVSERPVNEHGPDESSQLVAAIRSGDESAFVQLFRRNVTGLIRTASHIVRSETVAQDIVMDVFARVWRDRLSIPEDTRLPAYLTVAVRNACIDYLRHDRLELSVQEMSIEGGWAPGMSAVPLTPEQELERSEAKEFIRHAFTNLPRRMRQVLELRWLADKSYKEISKELGMPVKSVENYLGRAMRLLRDRMTRGG
ncbi:MAG TPA: sigma-70 family RNA polymerase sigma factor [Gemmatimonadaceae bacterium]|nr:sigma-70 family RNA polymerase sigma factor [Gemmatimonadaceae bacterium]